VEGRDFLNPETKNRVLFDSLPEGEQRRIYLQWLRGKQQDRQPAKDPAKLEETRAKVEKHNPWAIPLWDYYDNVQKGSGRGYHPPGDLEEIEASDYDSSNSVRIGEKDFDGTNVEFYQSLRKLQYTKKGPDGKPLRGEDRQLVYLTDEETLEKGYPLYDPAITAVHDGKEIGYIGNSFGATEVYMAKGYTGRGIGKFLNYVWRKSHPFRGSGGFSDAGLALFKNTYQTFVREALANGDYARGLEEGWLSSTRLLEILRSAGVDPRGKKRGKSTHRPPPAPSAELRDKRKSVAETVAKYVADGEDASWDSVAKSLDELDSLEASEGAKESEEDRRRRERGPSGDDD
jgi:hypothetical protein